jgi:hypothetical protein
LAILALILESETKNRESQNVAPNDADNVKSVWPKPVPTIGTKEPPATRDGVMLTMVGPALKIKYIYALHLIKERRLRW